MNEIKILKEDLSTDEIFRYLSIPNDGDVDWMLALINQFTDELIGLCRPRYTYKFFEINKSFNFKKQIIVGNTKLKLTGDSAQRYLDGASGVLIMAATLGSEVENLIRQCSLTDLTKSLIINAISTEMIEKYCDKAGDKILSNPDFETYYKKSRFSPGYGDLPIELQPDIINLLDANRTIGLTCTKSGIMIPRKSITAIIALFNYPVSDHGDRPCGICGFKQGCEKFKRGESCE